MKYEYILVGKKKSALGQRKFIIRFSSPPAPKNSDPKKKKLRWKTFSEATGLLLKTDFISLLRTANEL